MTTCSISQMALGFTSLCDSKTMSLDHTAEHDMPSHYIKTEPCEDSCSDIQVDGYIYGQAEDTFDTADHPDNLCDTFAYQLSPQSLLERSLKSPEQQQKTLSSRRERTPNTLRVMMEKHRHSERLRHHTLNERLKVICQKVPGSAEDGKETKVVMMQRIISYIAYLENTINLLCTHLGIEPCLHWLLLTTNTQDYLTNFEVNSSDSDSWVSTQTSCSRVLKKLALRDRHVKSTTSEVDVMTDSMVSVAADVEVGEEGPSLSQDSGVVASSTTGDDEQPVQAWTIVTDASADTGDLETLFGSSTDDGISAMFEVSSSTDEVESRAQGGYNCVIKAGNKENSQTSSFTAGSEQDSQVVPKLETASVSYNSANMNGIEHTSFNDAKMSPEQILLKREMDMGLSQQEVFLSGKWLRHHHPSLYAHKNKRKQYSPKRSPFSNLTNWKSEIKATQASEDGKSKIVQVLPYNIHYKQALTETQHVHFTRNSVMQRPIVPITYEAVDFSSSAATTEERPRTKVDLRKTSWMNGFMMFSRLNRRKFIEAHPGVHTSNISKIMGHAWRSMSPEEQAPFKEKAKLCAQELYRTYTSTAHDLSTQISAAETCSSATADSNTSVVTVMNHGNETCI
ncbi:uncharacterized protein LOC112570504 isoform X2 [Pomacea canaliculata]|uniref:uncharacterized protein LOC112570504 isoform X2 n=1 Tax=Pomacea canaliculata TaxID=400727 RepID=UPI000D73427F|nr:uncharacterized protein LOC112570504 isoform X2 [Pomacea canaliculata]